LTTTLALVQTISGTEAAIFQ